MQPLIEVRNLVKHFPRVQAVNGVSFSIRPGQCFGLLGPNGAGKTTTIEMMEGITRPTSGEILFRGKPIGREFKERSGIQFQSTAVQDFLQVKEVLKLFQSFYSKTSDIHELAKLCSLEEFWDQDIHKLSGGQRQRVLLAVALVNDPEIVFLDEPTTGLDPQARRNFWDLINQIKSRKKTVLLTTHYMEEAYVLCDEIAIMDRGKIIAEGQPDRLLKEHFQGVSIQVPKDDYRPLKTQGHWKITEKQECIEISTTDVNSALKSLLDEGINLSKLNIRNHTLEDLFLALTGSELRA